MSQPEPIANAPPNPRMKSLLRRLAPRLLIASFAVLAALKLADLAIGLVAHTHERHLLRLSPLSKLRHRSNEFDYIFRTNRLGLRGRDVPFIKPRGTFRIVVLGDSFVAGYGVAAEDLLTQLLEEKIAVARGAGMAAPEPDSSAETPTRVEVVNVGRVGTSTIRELDLYETIGRRFEPDLVILAYYLGNDLAEVMEEQTHAELAKWHPPGATRRVAYALYPNLYLELALFRQSRRQLREFTDRSESEILGDIRREARARGRDPAKAEAKFEALSPKIRRDVASGMLAEQRIVDSCIEPDRLVRALDPGDEYFGQAWARTQEHLERLRQDVAQDNARMAIVVIPAPVQVDHKSLMFHKALGYDVRESWLVSPSRTQRAIVDWARTAGVACLDLTDQFRAAEVPIYFIEDQHFTPEGHAAAADAICDFLLRDSLLSRKVAP